MPELPEVETVLRTLEHMIKGARIVSVKVIYPGIIEGDPEDFCRKLAGERFNDFERRGKYLIFRMDHVTFVSHLRMEGKYYVQQPEDPLDRHMHVLFDLDDGRQLRYRDTRKFGRMSVTDRDYDFASFHELGPEPFDSAFCQPYIHAYRKGKTQPLKSLLLDQSFVAGIGNIYADEILSACGLRPGRSCSRITKKDEENIVRETRRILSEAIAAGGTTIRTYTSSLGVSGLFQNDCCVHEQKICRRCGAEIHMKRIGGRSSYYCPVCQK
jgi:formamidopyrimidine-DNA glycosylase